eukprot:57114-Eustigmatos_ZCMA.PRE.1
MVPKNRAFELITPCSQDPTWLDGPLSALSLTYSTPLQHATLPSVLLLLPIPSTPTYLPSTRP